MVFVLLRLLFRICVIIVINQCICDGLEVNCIKTLNKRVYTLTEEPVSPYMDISFSIPDNECFIDEWIALEENDTLVIVPPSPDRLITTITFSRPSTLPAFPITIFQTFPNVSQVKLISTGIEVLEENDFINAVALKNLHLQLNYIRLISKTSFAYAISLEELTLSGNRIQVVENFSFETLKNLIKLDLQQNNLTNLTANLLAGADNLREIYLNDNQIDTIADGALYAESLERIYLQDNRLKVLSMDLLTGTPALYGIDLSGNQLVSVEGIFNKCSNLTVIGLKRNILETIDLMEFASLPSLMMLSLESNHLKFNESHIQSESTISNSMAAHNKWMSSKTHLEYLNLDSNNLSATQILHQLSIFKRLKFLDLDDNQFKQIDDLNIVRNIFPNFIQLNVNNNSLSCLWLMDVVPVVRKQGIILNTVEIDDDDDYDDSDKSNEQNFHQKEVFNIPCWG